LVSGYPFYHCIVCGQKGNQTPITKNDTIQWSKV
jgi:predicted nucleic acid-binding Zn ribbon protein